MFGSSRPRRHTIQLTSQCRHAFSIIQIRENIVCLPVSQTLAICSCYTRSCCGFPFATRVCSPSGACHVCAVQMNLKCIPCFTASKAIYFPFKCLTNKFLARKQVIKIVFPRQRFAHFHARARAPMANSERNTPVEEGKRKEIGARRSPHSWLWNKCVIETECIIIYSACVIAAHRNATNTSKVGAICTKQNQSNYIQSPGLRIYLFTI